MNDDIENLRIVLVQFHDAQSFSFEGTRLCGLLADKGTKLLVELFHCLSLDIDLVHVWNLTEILWNQVRDVDLLLLLLLFSGFSLV